MVYLGFQKTNRPIASSPQRGAFFSRRNEIRNRITKSESFMIKTSFPFFWMPFFDCGSVGGFFQTFALCHKESPCETWGYQTKNGVRFSKRATDVFVSKVLQCNSSQKTKRVLGEQFCNVVVYFSGLQKTESCPPIFP